MAILYVDGAPETALKNGHVLLTIASGGDSHTFLITRHAARFLERRVFQALDDLDGAETDFEPTPLRRPETHTVREG
jgi:hypothetical protein